MNFHLKKFLRKNNIQVYDTYTNFLVIKAKNNKKFVERLRRKKILVNSLANYPFNSNLLKNAVRITVPSLKKDFNALKAALKEINKK